MYANSQFSCTEGPVQPLYEVTLTIPIDLFFINRKKLNAYPSVIGNERVMWILYPPKTFYLFHGGPAGGSTGLTSVFTAISSSNPIATHLKSIPHHAFNIIYD